MSGRTFPAVIVAELAKETPAISYYLELTRSDGVMYRMATFDVNWHGVTGSATLGFAFVEPIAWSGSSTQTCKIALPRALTLTNLGADIGDLALANVLRNGTVKIWMRGGLDAELATALAAGDLQPWFDGRVMGCETAPHEVQLTCSTEYQAEGMTPSIRITAPTFNHLPSAGTTAPYGGGFVQITNEGL